MNTNVRSYLIEIARLPSRKTIYDMELSKFCGLELELKEPLFARAEMSRILTEICFYEHAQSRPLLGALVVTKSGEYLDRMLYEVGEKCNRVGWQQALNNMDFANPLRNECFDFWHSDKHYLKFK